MTESNNTNSYQQPVRVSFDDESRYSWLSILLDACHVIDKGVAEAINREQKQGRELACSKGCATCCVSHADIPVYPLELMGMTWYCTEKLQPPLREKIKQQLVDYKTHIGCPFLYENACSIHPIRPFACRQFNVLDKVCSEGEDAFHTRRNDVMTPIKRYQDEAFNIVLPFYGVSNKAEKRKAIKQGRLHALAKVMKECHWDTVAERMNEFDKQHG